VKKYYGNKANGTPEIPTIYASSSEITKGSLKSSKSPKCEEQKRGNRKRVQKNQKQPSNNELIPRIEIEHQSKVQTKHIDKEESIPNLSESIQKPESTPIALLKKDEYQKICEINSKALEIVEQTPNNLSFKNEMNEDIQNEKMLYKSQPTISTTTSVIQTIKAEKLKIHSLKQNKAVILRTGATIAQNTQNVMNLINNFSSGTYYNPYQDEKVQENIKALKRQITMKKTKQIRVVCSAARKNAKKVQSLRRIRNQKMTAKLKTHTSHTQKQRKEVKDAEQRKAKENVAKIQKSLEQSKKSYFNMVEEKKKNGKKIMLTNIYLFI
jgi:hypothetical protein